MKSSLKIFCAAAVLGLFTVPGIFAADFEIRQEAEFKKIVPAGSHLRKLAGGMKFIEGPVWVPAGGYLVFSDIPADELKKWSEREGLSVFRKPSHSSNGNTLDRQGRLVTCEHSGRRVAFQDDKNGALKTLVGEFDGKKFNSPNDVVVKSDGTIWFTDPDYGLGNNPKEMAGNFVFRFEPKTKKISTVVKDFDKPNGLCFSPDEQRLYVADSGQPHHIRVFDVKKDGSLENGKIFCVIEKGVPDGIRCDAGGRIWSSASDGVQIFAPDGSLIGKILAPESPANLCFGGKDFKTLFITAQTSLYAIDVAVKGAR